MQKQTDTLEYAIGAGVLTALPYAVGAWVFLALLNFFSRRR